jgi:hypothetical protein
VPGETCRLRRPRQHFVEVYSQEYGIQEFFWDAECESLAIHFPSEKHRSACTGSQVS